MSDGPRIDLAQARAAGLPERASNDPRAPLSVLPMPSGLPSRHGEAQAGAFSPLALLLARFVPSGEHHAPPAVPTPEEARLLHAYLQQRVVAALRATGAAVPAALDVVVEADGALRLTPAPPGIDARHASWLHHDPDIARLAGVLQRALLAQTLASSQPTAPDTPRMRAPGAREERTAWPWWLPFGATPAYTRRSRATTPGLRALAAIAFAALLLAWWLLG